MVQELLPTFSREDQISLFIFDRQGKLILPRAASCRLIAVDQTLPLRPEQLQADHRHPASRPAWCAGTTRATIF
jgi:hypothetical protein